MKLNAHALRIPGRQHGFTIVEIVMTFIIIGILTLVMVPVLTGRANDARLNACNQDLRNLGDALERAAVDTGYLYRLNVLNDVIGGDGIPNALDPKTLTPGVLDRVGGLRDNAIETGNIYKKPTYLFISTKGKFLPDSTEELLFTRLTGSKNGDLTVNPDAEANFHWNGPYINWKKDLNHNDWPDDSWGNDYLFFTPEGVIYPPDPTSTDPLMLEDLSFQFNLKGPQFIVAGTTLQYDAKGIFDRPTLLSLGPNGVPGNGTNDLINDGYGKGDDIVYTFGGN